LNAAKTEAADLIVVGVRHKAALADHAPWATVSKIIRGAHCPVLAVPAHVS
jgi:nucleotide-binding universal stress UspA family protein